MAAAFVLHCGIYWRVGSKFKNLGRLPVVRQQAVPNDWTVKLRICKTHQRLSDRNL